MIPWRAALLAALTLCLPPQGARAQQVQLSTPDAALRLDGRLLGWDGRFYRIETEHGEVTLDGSRVTCTGACPDQPHVPVMVFSGDATLTAVLMPALAEHFAQRRGHASARLEGPGGQVDYLLSRADGTALARLVFRTTTSAEGFADLVAGEADAALSLRPVRPEEVARGKEAYLGSLDAPGRALVVALDALVPLVAPDNPAPALSLAEIEAAFTGAVTGWSALGGPAAPLVPHLLEGAGDAALRLFAAPDLPERVQRHAVPEALADAVAADRHALGLGLASTQTGLRALTLRSDCGSGWTALPAALKSQDYPLTLPLYLYLPERRLAPVLREFLAYLQSPAAQLVVRRAGLVDQSLTTVRLREQGDRLVTAVLAAGEDVRLADLQRMLRRLDQAQRLAISFRFNDGAATLDPRSRSNVGLLAAALREGVYAGRRLLFAGFSDAAGDAEANRLLSRSRAEAVEAAVAAAAGQDSVRLPATEVAGFGEAMPVACDDTGWGRALNRRVEVWLLPPRRAAAD